MTTRDAFVIIGVVERLIVLKQTAMTVTMILLETKAKMTKATMTTMMMTIRMTAMILTMTLLFLKSLTLLWNSS